MRDCRGSGIHPRRELHDHPQRWTSVPSRPQTRGVRGTFRPVAAVQHSLARTYRTRGARAAAAVRLLRFDEGLGTWR